jgi:hypothetical protein
MPLQHPPIVLPLRHVTSNKRLILPLPALVFVSGLFSALIAGCGQTGTPLAPSLKLPTPVTDLTVSRVADDVTLKWTMPRRTTDKLPLKGPQPVQICRRTGDDPCLTVGTISVPPEKPASYDDLLPADLAGGSPQLLAYSIDVLSPHGRSAGASNIAYTAAGSAPPPFIHPRGEVSANGVVLQWQPDSLPGSDHKIDIERTLLSIPSPAKAEDKSKSAPLGGSAPQLAKEQTLVVHLPPGVDPGRALDPDAAFNQRYSYRISRVTTVSISGKSIDIEGASSAEIIVDTKDIFPPAPPTGLAAVAASDEGAIDLSWAPNTETDLAGYAVYRSTVGSEAVRISPLGKPIDTPAFRDATAQPGREYAYSVTAIDRDGNQSPRSVEIKESLPPKP